MNEIRKWLTESGSFDAGLHLLQKHMQNRFMLRSIERRHDTDKLRYELEKIAGIGMPVVQKGSVPTVTAEARMRTEIVREGSIRVDELPPPLQHIYGQVCEQYRRMRSLHEKLKLVATDAERATVRKELVALDRQRREGWAVIDRWRRDGTLPVMKPATEVMESIPDYKAVQAARLAVSRLLKQLEGCDAVKAEPCREKIKKAVATITAAGGTFNKLSEPLRKHGFIE